MQAVSFDLDGTLYDLARARPVVVRHCLFRLRLLRAWVHERETLRAMVFDGGAEFLQAEAERVAARVARRPAQVRAELDRKITPAIARALAKIGPFDDVKATLARLRTAGLRLALVTDHAAASKLLALGLSCEDFDAISVAEEQGALKPHPRVFLHAAAQLGLAPEAVVHIGDRLDLDVAGAHAAGMQAILLARRDTQAATQVPVVETLTGATDLILAAGGHA